MITKTIVVTDIVVLIMTEAAAVSMNFIWCGALNVAICMCAWSQSHSPVGGSLAADSLFQWSDNNKILY